MMAYYIGIGRLISETKV